MNIGTLLRSWLACTLGCLPLLILLLVPKLMRSRAGDERLLLIGTALLLLLLVAAFVCAPIMTAWFDPVRGNWDRRTALRSTRRGWRHSTGGAVIALCVGILIYALGQMAGYMLGTLVPYVSDNPAHVSDPSQPRWVIHYTAYALQALILYAVATLAVAWYGWRMRTLHLRKTIRQSAARR
ncbi:hypothetical protein [Microbacterium sp. AK031]|uniref:hypothetical protein n=1 Tax=Microbacterium sp. AK031 TaxID=2723076 RepID=UPI002169D564|nr:hypothetical protein [Microbacterium sp. AK031]MCS3844724.1 hypothetical protein [Microbacterium sp. AK031]